MHERVVREVELRGHQIDQVGGLHHLVPIGEPRLSQVAAAEAHRAKESHARRVVNQRHERGHAGGVDDVNLPHPEAFAGSRRDGKSGRTLSPEDESRLAQCHYIFSFAAASRCCRRLATRTVCCCSAASSYASSSSMVESVVPPPSTTGDGGASAALTRSSLSCTCPMRLSAISRDRASLELRKRSG